MLNTVFTKLAQFGTGIEPIVQGHPYTQDSNSNDYVVGNVEQIISTILGVLTVLGGVFFIIYFFAAAIMWVTAGGDSGKITKARDQMVQGILGLVILVSAYTVIGLAGQIVGLDLLDLGGQLTNVAPI